MDITGKDRITFEVVGTDDLSDTFEINLTEEDTLVLLGTIKVEKSRARAILKALEDIVRSSHGPYKDHERALVKVDNKTSGTIRFE